MGLSIQQSCRILTNSVINPRLLLAKKLRGEEVQIPENKQVIVPTRAIDKSNVDEFWANLKKLRGH